MFVISIIGFLAGVILGLRCRVFVLIPAILLVAAIAITTGVLSGLDPLALALGTMLAVASPQIGYLVTVSVNYAAGAHLRKRAVRRKQDLLRAVRAGIGQGLKVVFELPQELPQEMTVLIAEWTNAEKYHHAGLSVADQR